MKLTRETKYSVTEGDKLTFENGDKYTVMTVIKGQRGAVCFTIQDENTKQVIYSYPSSRLYGAEIEKQEDQKMNFSAYMKKYQKFFDKWNDIQKRNEYGDYSHGAAIYGPSCDKVIAFDDDTQKENYMREYGFDND